MQNLVTESFQLEKNPEEQSVVHYKLSKDRGSDDILQVRGGQHEQKLIPDSKSEIQLLNDNTKDRNQFFSMPTNFQYVEDGHLG